MLPAGIEPASQVPETYVLSVERRERDLKVTKPAVVRKRSLDLPFEARRNEQRMERVRGVEPPSPAWEAGVLAVEPHPHPHESDFITGEGKIGW